MGIQPQIYHLNEGHAAFALLEIARKLMETGKAFDEVKDAVRSRCVFTTHTPVPAGQDTFSQEQIERYFCDYWQQLRLSKAEFMQLGSRQAKDSSEPFNMTALTLKLTKAANGVSKINGECRQMWTSL